jgi:hypothetical protein
MFSPNPKNDPLLSAIKGVIAENDKHRDAVDRANDHFKITDKRQLPHNLHAEYDALLKESNNLSEKITKSTPMGDVISDFEKSDAPQFEGKSMEKRRQMAIAAKMSMNEALKGNQHKIDANKNNRIDAHDFKLLRNMDEDVMLEAVTNLLQKDTLSESEYNTIMESAFGVAFQKARREGQAEFEFGGKQYKSIMKGENEADWKAGLAKNAAPPVPMARRADRPAPVPVAKVEPAPVEAPSVKPNVNRGVPGATPAVKLNVNQVVPGATPAASPVGGFDQSKTRLPSDGNFTNTPVDGNQGSQPYWGAKPAPAAAPVVPATPVRATKSIQQIGQEIQNSTLSGYREIQHSGPSTVAKGRKLNEANEGSDEGTLTMQRYAKMFRGKR